MTRTSAFDDIRTRSIAPGSLDFTRIPSVDLTYGTSLVTFAVSPCYFGVLSDYVSCLPKNEVAHPGLGFPSREDEVKRQAHPKSTRRASQIWSPRPARLESDSDGQV